MSGGLLTLHYGKHHVSVASEVRSWWESERWCDVVLVCSLGTQLRAHSLVLASASPLLAKLLSEVPQLEPTLTLHLPDVMHFHLASLLRFLYTGHATLQVIPLV